MNSSIETKILADLLAISPAPIPLFTKYSLSFAEATVIVALPDRTSPSAGSMDISIESLSSSTNSGNLASTAGVIFTAKDASRRFFTALSSNCSFSWRFKDAGLAPFVI